MVALRLGMDGEELEALRLAALIHDVGKISVPAEILSKPGRLSDNEFELIKVHAQAGHDVLQSIAFDRPVAEMVLQHHERLDGSGYPQGLRGEGILPAARVIAVADVYEAMTSHRPTGPAWRRTRPSPNCARGRAGATTPRRSRPAWRSSTRGSCSRPNRAALAARPQPSQAAGSASALRPLPGSETPRARRSCASVVHPS